jgi:hypothetical protein
MRSDDNQQEGMFSYISPGKRVPADHPLRAKGQLRQQESQGKAVKDLLMTVTAYNRRARSTFTLGIYIVAA